MRFVRGLGLITPLLLIIVLTGCYPKRSTSLKDIATAEQNLETAKQGGKIDSKVIDDDIEAHRFHAAYFPYDSLTPQFIIREGELYQMNGDYNKAISALDDVRKLYPKSKTIPDALFLIATIYEQNIKNQDSADFRYATLLFDYPDSKAAQQTHTLLQNKGISSEDFYKKQAAALAKAENSNRADSASKALRYHAYWK